MRKILVGATVALLVAAAAAPAAATKDEAKVFICHRTMSEKNPYVLVHVDVASYQSGEEGNAHLHHTNLGQDFFLGYGVKGDYGKDSCQGG